MANEDILTDDYVAGLLAKDAKESSIKYSALGLEAFTQSRPPANKPKPNTRFLRNIIKDTDSHNAALLAKEAAESKARLQSLSGNEHREKKASHVGGGEIRRRQLGDIAAILGGRPSKRRRNDDIAKKDDVKRRRANTSSEDEETKAIDESRSTKRPRKEDGRENKRSERDEKRTGTLDGDRKRSHRRNRSKERSYSEDRRKGDHRRRHRDRSRERGNREEHRRRRSRSRSPNEASNKDSDRHHHSRESGRLESSGDEKSHSSRKHKATSTKGSEDRRDLKVPARKEKPKPDYDSDPLDDIIGPRPPVIPKVKLRGRGATSLGAGIDSRFSASYDPTTDVQLDPEEENDWDQALEALRDRQKWKQQGADRLRAAGFTDDEIAKWEKGGEKREEDVKWAKSGESREWDRGKVLDGEGTVNIDPGWGRLKDN